MEKNWVLCIVGGYTLDLSCVNSSPAHTYRTDRASFGGKNRTVCVKQARAAGWLVNIKKDTAVCPDCRSKTTR